MGETQAAQAQLAESSARLSGAEEAVNAKLRDRGVILNDAIMQQMTYEERLAYRAQQEGMVADTILQAWLAHYLGRAATEEEFAAARNAALNENVTAQEAAMAAIQDAHGATAKRIMTADAETTAAILEAFKIRKQIQIDGATELTHAEQSAAQQTQQAWVAANGAVSQSAARSAEETKSAWRYAVDFVVGLLTPLFELIGMIGRGLGLLGPRSGGGGVGLATGGMVQQSGWAMVGERGPELVSLPRGSTVYDAEQTRSAQAGGGGGHTINITIHTAATDGAGISRTIADQLRLELRARGI
jgi:hypothetical protein